jgi:MFS family permease
MHLLFLSATGPLVDAYGGKLLLIISFTSSAGCYAMTATAGSIWMLFVSRCVCVCY